MLLYVNWFLQIRAWIFYHLCTYFVIASVLLFLPKNDILYLLHLVSTCSYSNTSRKSISRWMRMTFSLSHFVDTSTRIIFSYLWNTLSHKLRHSNSHDATWFHCFGNPWDIWRQILRYNHSQVWNRWKILDAYCLSYTIPSTL